jgi:hypothetical protein
LPPRGLDPLATRRDEGFLAERCRRPLVCDQHAVLAGSWVFRCSGRFETLAAHLEPGR